MKRKTQLKKKLVPGMIRFVHFQITILNRNVEKLHLGNQLMQSKILAFLTLLSFKQRSCGYDTT